MVRWANCSTSARLRRYMSERATPPDHRRRRPAGASAIEGAGSPAAGEPGDSMADVDRALWQAIQDWMVQDAEGRTVLSRTRADPSTAAETLGAWFRARARLAPPSLSTSISGGHVERLINIAQAGVVQLPPEV